MQLEVVSSHRVTENMLKSGIYWIIFRHTMRLKSALLTLPCLVLLIGCGDEVVDTSTSNNSNPLSHQMEALKKAKNLEAELNQTVIDKLKAIDAQK